MNKLKIDKELKEFQTALIDSQNWYHAKALEVLVNELYEYLNGFTVFNASFHYFVPFDGWTFFRNLNDCQWSAGELVQELAELHIKHGGSWAFYIENGVGDPKYFIEFDGYEFYYDEILEGDY